MTTPSVRISNELEERKREKKNAIYSGHLRLCHQPRAAHALRSDQFKQETINLHDHVLKNQSTNLQDKQVIGLQSTN